MEIKYTSDGKKVVVIGNLNSKEKIVQEIFVVNNQEVPSGENFVVKSLHDAPAISWKEKAIKEVEDNYEKTKTKYDMELARLKKDYDIKSKELKHRLEYVGAALKNASPESFNTFVDMLTGNIKWVVVDQYTPELLTWEEFNTLYEGRLRLISIFGKDDGSFTYAKGYYSDYSGGSTQFTPFDNQENAFSYFKCLILKTGISDKIIEVANKYNIELPSEDLKLYKERRADAYKSNIEHNKNEIAKWEKCILDLNQLI